MRQTITTRYRGATANGPSRVIAKASGGERLSKPWDYALTTDGNHIAAAKALRDKLAWGGEWIGGGLPDGCVFVDVSDALSVWPCGNKEGASFGIITGEGFSSRETVDRPKADVDA